MNAKDEEGGKTPRFSSWRSWRLGFDLSGGRLGKNIRKSSFSQEYSEKQPENFSM
jgi:hypothetical protein